MKGRFICLALVVVVSTIGSVSANTFTGGFEFAILKPHIDNDIAFRVAPVLVVGGGDGNSTQNGDLSTTTYETFSYDHELSPRLWLGYETCSGFNTRLRYWQFDNGAPTRSFTDVNGEYSLTSLTSRLSEGGVSISRRAGAQITASSALDAYIIDWDFGQRFCWRCWYGNIGLGFRHGAIAHAYLCQGWLPQPGLQNDLSLSESSRMDSRFDGVGPAIFFELERPLGNCGLSLVAVGRYSALYGQYKSLETDFYLNQAEEFRNYYRLNEDSSVRIAEVQIGIEYEKVIGDAGQSVFCRALWETQSWDGGGSLNNTLGTVVLSGATFSVGFYY